jgi:nuclear transport factor 2 (NTF2) superfamily protein
MMHTPDIDRLMAEARRREDVERVERDRREAALLRRWEAEDEDSVTAEAWHYALTRLAAIFAVGAALLALAGVLAVLP